MSFSFRRDRFRIDDEAWLVLILVFVVTTGYGPLNSGASYRAFRYTNRTRTVPPLPTPVRKSIADEQRRLPAYRNRFRVHCRRRPSDRVLIIPHEKKFVFGERPAIRFVDPTRGERGGRQFSTPAE